LAKPDETLAFCERSDRLLRAVLGDTPERTVRWLVPLVLIVLIVAGGVSLAGLSPR
jgi:hypothetical protein